MYKIKLLLYIINRFYRNLYLLFLCGKIIFYFNYFLLKIKYILYLVLFSKNNLLFIFYHTHYNMKKWLC